MRSCSRGFLPQNDVIKLQWAVLEACQTEATAQALGILLRKNEPAQEAENDTNPDDDAGQALAAEPEN